MFSSKAWRQGLALAGVAALASTLAACGSGSGGNDSNVIKIGVVTPTSGSFAEIGKRVVEGATIAVDEINAKGGIDGRKLKLVIKDEKVDPVQTVKDLRELSSEGVNVAVGFATSADCLAAGPVAQQLNMVFLGSCNDNSLISDKFNEHFFQVAAPLKSLTKATTSFIQSEYPNVGKWDIYSLDYVTGKSQASAFKEELPGAIPDVTFGKEVYAPLTTSDVRSYVSALKSASQSGSRHALYVYAYGAPDIAFLKQASQSGLYDNYDAVVNVAGDVPSAQGVGAQMKPTWNIYDYYYEAYDNPMNDQFIKTFQEKYDSPPVAWAAQSNTGVLALAKALEKTKGVSTGDKIIKALEGLSFDTVKGPLTFRASDHVLEQSVVAFKCQGDSSQKAGFTCPAWKVIPADKVLTSSEAKR